MDRLDLKLLAALQADGGRTNAALAEEVGLSPSSCLRRVRRLKRTGIIRKTVTLVDPNALDRGLTAIVEVELERHGDRRMRDFIAQARSERAVTHVYAVTGEVDVILMLRLVDMAEYQDLCERLFHNDGNVARFRTLFVMETAKEETAIPIDAIVPGL